MTIGDIAIETRVLTDTDSTSYTNANLLRRLNTAYEDIVSFILGIDGTWQFDDTRFTSFPIGTTSLINAQKDYSFDISVLEVERVEVLDNTGIWRLVNPIDISEITNIATSEFFKANGLPYYYDKQGSSILLYPSPDNGATVTLASGLKVYFQRTASIFTSAELTTGTAIPGFASPFHVLLAYKAALPYALSYKKDRVPTFVGEIARIEKDLTKFYGRRERDRRKVLSMNNAAFR